ncbi:MAG: GNAT family N-acetyltransferase [Eubacteriales bacterium]
MKIKIFTEGGKDIGLGHISRCSSLYNEVVDRGIPVDFIVYGDIADVIFLNGINITNENWLGKEYLLNNLTSDDYVIIDSYKATQEIYDIITKKSKKALFIDDIGRIAYSKGIIVNPSLDASHIDYSQSQNSILLSGPEYVILRQQFRGIKRKNISNEVKRVLIIMGGTDIRGLTPLIINNICRDRLDIEFDIVIGSKDKEKIQLQVCEDNNITFHNNLNATQMMKLMVNADFAITAAGQTIYELLATETPFIPIQIAENQSNNINSLHKLELIINSIDYSSDSLVKELNESFVQLLDYKVRNDLVLKIENIIDGKGRERIIKKLVNNETNSIGFRAISPSDCDLLYKWANDESVRKNAFNSDKIDYESHKKWFQNKLDSKNTLIYIILKDNTPIGQIRIDIQNDYGIIDYSIVFKYRGQGLGKSSLKSIGNRINVDCPTLNKLVGRVKFNNVSSQKAFESADFKKEKKNGYFEYQIKL